MIHNALGHVLLLLPDECAREIVAIERELLEAMSWTDGLGMRRYPRVTENMPVAACVVWCVREVLKLRARVHP